jgi:hypothetical protein
MKFNSDDSQTTTLAATGVWSDIFDFAIACQAATTQNSQNTMPLTKQVYIFPLSIIIVDCTISIRNRSKHGFLS